MATAAGRDLLERAWDRAFGFEHSHDHRTKTLVLAFAVLLAVYASWLLADLRLRTPAFLLVAVGTTYLLYARPTRLAVLIRGLYAVALALLATPVVLSLSTFVLPHGRGAVTDPWALSMTVGDLAFLVVFGLIAAIPAGIAFGLGYRR